MRKMTLCCFALISILVVTPLASGCMNDRCGDKLEYVDGVCVEKSSPTADQGVDTTVAKTDGSSADLVASDASADTVLADSVPAADTGAITGLGDPCKTNTECKATADYCAVQPPATTGYCTITGCDPKVPASCPSGYYCFDLSIFDPKLPKMCAKK
jgi:hypothetical protein